ncbi:DNA alkylation repair protein [Uliginosibacterium sp. 31-12]|uniref:DNA alkylation repair protein n=1 Tax=Uliginosibacterium sp. 31-12 TaxID=3062781 RepID=UPI0026E2B404|nr:DNA alkylation repair protein [Uliginosibacterium sp. 31-12]MDO6387870.1 DNA alkylation repair protein [Uliginosibacterium sp. 31-12]
MAAFDMKDWPAPQVFAASLREQLAAQAEPSRAGPMAAYMQQRFAFFGLPTPARRAAVKPLLASLGKAPDPDWLLAVAQALWAFDERECQYVAVDLLVKFAARLEARHEPQLAALVQAKAWWDSVDLLAAHVYGGLCRRAPALRARLDGYATHEDIWLRRVAILHQLMYAGDTDRVRLAATLAANLDQTDFFIRKAMGWALRQFARTDPAWVRAWLEAHGGQVSGLTRREALKRLG